MKMDSTSRDMEAGNSEESWNHIARRLNNIVHLVHMVEAFDRCVAMMAWGDR